MWKLQKQIKEQDFSDLKPGFSGLNSGFPGFGDLQDYKLHKNS